MGMTIGQAIDAIVDGFGVKLMPGTVDTLKIGNPKWPHAGTSALYAFLTCLWFH